MHTGRSVSGWVAARRLRKRRSSSEKSDQLTTLGKQGKIAVLGLGEPGNWVNRVLKEENWLGRWLKKRPCPLFIEGELPRVLIAGGGNRGGIEKGGNESGFR